MSLPPVSAAIADRVPAPELPLEREVVERARAGESEAFRVIFERHAPAVRRFLGDLFRDAPAADEATQETFVRAHSKIRSLEEGDRLSSWLLGIARRVFLEQLRKRRRDPEPLPEEEPHEVDTAPSPEAALLSGEADRILDGALVTLSEERRAALLLRIDHGLGYGEIAEAMGWTLQKVKNEIHRARLHLRGELATYLAGVR